MDYALLVMPYHPLHNYYCTWYYYIIIGLPDVVCQKCIFYYFYFTVFFNPTVLIVYWYAQGNLFLFLFFYRLFHPTVGIVYQPAATSTPTVDTRHVPAPGTILARTIYSIQLRTV